MGNTATATRASALQHALRLEYLTVGWNVIEGVIAVTAGLAAGSVALLGFGLDSFVETASGGVLIWRQAAERQMADPASIERLDRKAQKFVGASLFVLASTWRETPCAFEKAKAAFSISAPEPAAPPSWFWPRAPGPP